MTPFFSSSVAEPGVMEAPDIDRVVDTEDLDGARTLLLEAWADWRHVHHTIKVDGLTRDLYRVGYYLDYRIDRLVRCMWGTA